MISHCFWNKECLPGSTPKLTKLKHLFKPKWKGRKGGYVRSDLIFKGNAPWELYRNSTYLIRAIKWSIIDYIEFGSTHKRYNALSEANNNQLLYLGAVA